MSAHGFETLRVELDGDPFTTLAAGVDFLDVGRGRQGTHLVDVSARGVPLVRTTSRYDRPATRFSAAHRRLAEAIGRATGRDPAPRFDNALIEIYDRTYSKMGAHCDQALDLAAGSVIALYSCYARPDDRSALRMLMIRSKSGDVDDAIALEHGSVVLFDLETNRRHLHKIVLSRRPPEKAPDNRWLGVTLRCSRTPIRFDGGRPISADGTPLRLADEAERKAFYRLRGRENREVDFVYPPLDYTLSPADLMPPAD